MSYRVTGFAVTLTEVPEPRLLTVLMLSLLRNYLANGIFRLKGELNVFHWVAVCGLKPERLVVKAEKSEIRETISLAEGNSTFWWGGGGGGRGDICVPCQVF
jgi:hypothetical protein